MVGLRQIHVESLTHIGPSRTQRAKHWELGFQHAMIIITPEIHKRDDGSAEKGIPSSSK